MNGEGLSSQAPLGPFPEARAAGGVPPLEVEPMARSPQLTASAILATLTEDEIAELDRSPAWQSTAKHTEDSDYSGFRRVERHGAEHLARIDVAGRCGFPSDSIMSRVLEAVDVRALMRVLASLGLYDFALFMRDKAPAHARGEALRALSGWRVTRAAVAAHDEYHLAQNAEQIRSALVFAADTQRDRFATDLNWFGHVESATHGSIKEHATAERREWTSRLVEATSAKRTSSPVPVRDLAEMILRLGECEGTPMDFRYYVQRFRADESFDRRVHGLASTLESDSALAA